LPLGVVSRSEKVDEIAVDFGVGVAFVASVLVVIRRFALCGEVAAKLAAARVQLEQVMDGGVGVAGDEGSLGASERRSHLYVQPEHVYVTKHGGLHRELDRQSLQRVVLDHEQLFCGQPAFTPGGSFAGLRPEPPRCLRQSVGFDRPAQDGSADCGDVTRPLCRSDLTEEPGQHKSRVSPALVAKRSCDVSAIRGSQRIG
jgi:hypothetical protein